MDEAEADFARGRALDPDNPSSYYLGGLCSLDARGDAVEAARLLRRSTEVDPADPELFAWLAHAYLTLDEHAQGARAADRAVELGPANGLALSTRALAHACAGEEQSAFDVAGHGLEPAVLQRFGSRLLLLRILRTTLLRQGRAADAVRAYEGAYPTVGQAKSLLEAPLEHPQFGGFGELVGAAIDLAHLRRMGGDDAGAATLTRLVRGSLEREPRMQFLRLFGPGTADAQLAILEGRPKDALAALTRVVDAGWIANWRFVIEHDVIWDAIRPDPAFRRIVERLEANTQRQRAALHATNGPSKSAAGST